MVVARTDAAGGTSRMAVAATMAHIRPSAHPMTARITTSST